jgi:hypothetical protein
MTGCERVLARLRQGPATHHDIYALHVVGHSRIAELRRRGHRIECEQTTDQRGERLYTYRLLKDASGADGCASHAPSEAASDASLSLLVETPPGFPAGSQSAGDSIGGLQRDSGRLEPPALRAVTPADPGQVEPEIPLRQLSLAVTA